jgi:hypothetical protein
MRCNPDDCHRILSEAVGSYRESESNGREQGKSRSRAPDKLLAMLSTVMLVIGRHCAGNRQNYQRFLPAASSG